MGPMTQVRERSRLDDEQVLAAIRAGDRKLSQVMERTKLTENRANKALQRLRKARKAQYAGQLYGWSALG